MTEPEDEHIPADVAEELPSQANRLEFYIPEHLDDEDDIRDYFEENIKDLYPAMNLELPNEGREVIDEVVIKDFQLSEDCVTLSYEVRYSAYMGCRDMNYNEFYECDLHGDRDGHCFTFDRFVAPEKRSTLDEF